MVDFFKLGLVHEDSVYLLFRDEILVEVDVDAVRVPSPVVVHDIVSGSVHSWNLQRNVIVVVRLVRQN